MSKKQKVDRAMDPQYSLEGLERAIRAAEVNIATFEDAINTERENIGKFKFMKDAIERKEAEAKEAEEMQEKANPKE